MGFLVSGKPLWKKKNCSFDGTGTDHVWPRKKETKNSWGLVQKGEGLEKVGSWTESTKGGTIVI